MATTNATLDPFLPTAGGLDQTSNGFLLWGAALVFIMTPGLGLFYSGMSRSKNALTMIMLCMTAMCVVSLQWVLFGFSLTFGEGDLTGKGSVLIGNLQHYGLTGVGFDAFRIAPAVSAIALCIYQMQFATITAALIFGSVAERVRVVPSMVFVFLWTTLAYDPIAYWTWSLRGWIRNFSCINSGTDLANGPPCGTGGLDFAGGGPVHIASGFAGLAFCLVLGRRRREPQEEFRPHNLVNVFLGASLLWFGWFAFNGGSALAGTTRAVMAGTVTHIATVSGALAWPIADSFLSRRMSGLGFCSGAIAALVSITPAAGFVAPWAAVIIGASAGVVCNFACRIKGYLGFDDSLDAWGVHGVGGFLGLFLTGVLSQKWIPTLDGTNSAAATPVLGGAVDGHPVQIAWQLAGGAAIAGWSFTVAFVLLSVINMIPGLHLRPTEDEEIQGGDLAEMGEVAY
ncbi:ammonium transporter AmtB-like domain-containing protein, partial [Zopfochytrium polystomum]